MGFQIQSNAPQISVGDRVFYIGAWLWSPGIVPDKYRIAILEEVPQQGLTIVYEVPLPNGILAEVQKRGGKMLFIKWIIGLFNSFFNTLFGVPVEIVEPITEEEARAEVTRLVNILTISLVNNIPVVKE